MIVIMISVTHSIMISSMVSITMSIMISMNDVNNDFNSDFNNDSHDYVNNVFNIDFNNDFNNDSNTDFNTWLGARWYNFYDLGIFVQTPQNNIIYHWRHQDTSTKSRKNIEYIIGNFGKDGRREMKKVPV